MKTIVKITDFGKRHFDSKFGATKILDKTPEEIEDFLNKKLNAWEPENVLKSTDKYFINELKVIDGYADFCKLIVVKNFTDARIGTMAITLGNYQYLQTGYSARTDEELAVLSRWFVLPLPKPKADYLVFVCYSKEQIEKEAQASYKKEVKKWENSEYSDPAGMPQKPKSFEAPWGIVSINGQTHANEEPMSPVTMMRNALGVEEGGSGVPINREQYEKSVIFWSQNAIIC